MLYLWAFLHKRCHAGTSEISPTTASPLVLLKRPKYSFYPTMPPDWTLLLISSLAIADVTQEIPSSRWLFLQQISCRAPRKSRHGNPRGKEPGLWATTASARCVVFVSSSTGPTVTSARFQSSGVWDVWGIAYDLFVGKTNSNGIFKAVTVKILTALSLRVLFGPHRPPPCATFNHPLLYKQTEAFRSRRGHLVPRWQVVKPPSTVSTHGRCPPTAFMFETRPPRREAE